MYPKLFVLLVTISEFDDERIPALPAGVVEEGKRIVEQIAAMSTSNPQHGMMEVEIIHVGASNGRATKKDIANAVEYLEKRATPSDGLIFYMVTHTKLNSFAMSDSDLSSKTSAFITMISCHELVSLLNIIPTTTKLLFLNTYICPGLLTTLDECLFGLQGIDFAMPACPSEITTVPQWPLANWKAFRSMVDERVGMVGMQIVFAETPLQETNGSTLEGSIFGTALQASFEKAGKYHEPVYDVTQYQKFMQTKMDKMAYQLQVKDGIFLGFHTLKEGKLMIPIIDQFPLYFDKQVDYIWTTDLFRLDLLLSKLQVPAPELVWELRALAVAVKMRGIKYLDSLHETLIPYDNKAQFLDPYPDLKNIQTYLQAILHAIVAAYQYIENYPKTDPIYVALCSSFISAIVGLSFYFPLRVFLSEKFKSTKLTARFKSIPAPFPKLFAKYIEHEKIFLSLKAPTKTYGYLTAFKPDQYTSEKFVYAWTLLTRSDCVFTSERAFNVLNALPFPKDVNVADITNALETYTKKELAFVPNEVNTFLSRASANISEAAAKTIAGCVAVQNVCFDGVRPLFARDTKPSNDNTKNKSSDVGAAKGKKRSRGN